MEKINLMQKFTLFSDYWNPKIVGELNQFAVKIVKVRGEFVWHHHDQEDELFFVVKGNAPDVARAHDHRQYRQCSERPNGSSCATLVIWQQMTTETLSVEQL